MMTVWQRMRRVVGARAHARVDALENPGQMLDQLQRELVAAVAEAKAGLASARLFAKRAAGQLDDTAELKARAEAAARTALADGDEAMARTAMARALKKRAEIDALDKTAGRAERLVERQRKRLAQLKTDLAELKEKRLELIQRSRLAQSLNQAAGSADSLAEPVALVVERLEEKITRHEAAADLAFGFDEVGDNDDSLDRYISDRALDAAIADLKTRLDDEGDRS